MSVQPPGAAVTMLVVDAARLMRRRFEAELAKSDTGLTAGAARTLFYVWTNPGLRQAALAEKMYVEPMTLVGYLDNLEKAGLIRRCPDPKDGRAKVIELLPQADSVLEVINTALLTVRTSALNAIPAERQRDLEDMLQMMMSGLAAE